MATFRIRPGLRKSDPKPNSNRSLAVRRGARWRGRRKTINCCLRRRFSAITARTPPRPHSVAVMTTRSKQGEQEVLHARDSVGQTSGATQRCLNLGFSERIGNSRRTGNDGLHCCTPLARNCPDPAESGVPATRTSATRTIAAHISSPNSVASALVAIQVLVPPESRTGQLADLSAGVTVEGDRVEISYAVGTRSARSD